MESRLPQPSVEDVLFVLFKWWRGMLWILAATLFCALFWLYFLRDDLFTAEAKILVKNGQADVLPTTAVTPRAGTVGYRSADVKSEVDILQSTDLLNEVITQYKLDQPRPRPVPPGIVGRTRYYVKGGIRWVREKTENVMIAVGLRERLTEREKVLAGMQRGLNVRVRENSNIVVAELSLPFRQGSGAVLNALLDSYQKFRLTIYRDRGDEFFRREMEVRDKALQAAEKEKNQFERASQITSQPQQKELLLKQIADLENARHVAEVQSREADEKVQRLTNERAKGNPNMGGLGGFDSVFPRSLATEVATLKRKREELLLTDREDSERVTNVDSQIRVLQDMLAANLHSVREEKKARLDSATQELHRVQGHLAQLHADEVRWMDLTRKTQQLNEEYQFYRRKFDETSATRSATEQRISDDVAVTAHAIDPLQPSGMRKTLYLVVAFVAGLILALTYAVTGEFFDQRVLRVERLEQELGAPVLAVIPRQSRAAAGS